jgi:phospholipase C
MRPGWRAADTAHRVQYGEADIPGYFDYARRFTLCDRYFSEVAGPSTPNHLMLICADAPIIDNPATSTGRNRATHISCTRSRPPSSGRG